MLDFDDEVTVTDLGVEVDDDVLAVIGTVESCAMRQAGERAVFRVKGVRAVANDVVAKMPGVGAPTDTALAKSWTGRTSATRPRSRSPGFPGWCT